MLANWSTYCERNWISANHTDVFCGENKVKRFLNGLSYFLLLGDTEGMVTDYKESMNGKREIPMSSCPSQIEDMVYGTGSVLHPPTEEEEAAFKMMLKSAEDRLPAKKKAGKPSLRNKKKTALFAECGKDAELTYASVDTDNRFIYENVIYEIDPAVTEYAAKETPLGLLYDMDKVVCVKSRDGSVSFYTAEYDRISGTNVKKVS